MSIALRVTDRAETQDDIIHTVETEVAHIGLVIGTTGIALSGQLQKTRVYIETIDFVELAKNFIMCACATSDIEDGVHAWIHSPQTIAQVMRLALIVFVGEEKIVVIGGQFVQGGVRRGEKCERPGNTPGPSR
jgi:hypothetical protein